MWLRMTLVIVTLVTAGCVAIPYYASESSETFIEEETLKFIEIGKSTRAELQQTIGLPDWSFNDGSRWIYKVSASKPGGWGGCYIEVISIEGSAGCGRSYHEPVMTILDLSISDLDVISKQEISTVKRDACIEPGVCLGAWYPVTLHASPEEEAHAKQGRYREQCWESPVTLYASPEEEAHVKQFQAEPEQCLVFLYTDSPDTNCILSVDSVRVLRAYRKNSEFLLLRLDPGKHRILVASHSKISMENSGIIDIDCLAGGIHFLRERKFEGPHSVMENGATRDVLSHQSWLALVPDDLGRSAIMDKTLHLLPGSELMDKGILPLPDSALLPASK